MFKKIKERYIQLGLTRYYRVERYLRVVESEITLLKGEGKEQAEEIRDIINHKIKILKKLTWTSFAVYVAIYFSFISFFLGDLVLFQEISQIIAFLISLFGTTVFIVIALLLNRILELYYQDLQLLTSHLISIYNSRGVLELDPNMERKIDTSKVFIDFFKKN